MDLRSQYAQVWEFGHDTLCCLRSADNKCNNFKHQIQPSKTKFAYKKTKYRIKLSIFLFLMTLDTIIELGFRFPI